MSNSLRNLSTKKFERIILRKHQTKAETVLWSFLRAGRLSGHKFYRQYSLGPFIVDFYCHKKRLAIELDGESHKTKSEYDFSRTIWLENNGITIIRFWNNEIIKYPKEACERILEQLK